MTGNQSIPEINSKIQQARTLQGEKHGDYEVAFKNIPAAVQNRAAQYPDQEFLIFYSDERTRLAFNYSDFAERVGKLAATLSSQFQIAKGDRVATLMVNHPHTVFTYFAVWSLGAVVVPINVEETEERTRFILENSGAKLCVAAAETFSKARICSGELTVLPSSATQGLSLEKIFSEPAKASVPAVSILPDDDALIVYTSGTTGVPKGVLLSQYNLLADARAISEMHAIEENVRMMCVLPIHHVNGTVVTLMTPLYAGSSVVLNPRFSASSFWKMLAQEDVAIVSVVPTLLHFLYEKNDDLSRYELKNFRHFICGAGPLTVDLATRFESRFGFRIVHGYGLSETTCYSCFLPPVLSKEEHQVWIRDHGFPSIGIAVPSNEMQIQSPEGESLAPGERGEIVIRGHNVMKGYYKNSEANENAFTHGWFRSGDEGFFTVDSKGNAYFFITGRIKELIARGGVKFSPLEIDEVLNSIPGVRHGVAVGFESDAYGEEVGAYVELDPEAQLSEAEILALCGEKLSFAKQPKVVKFGRDIPYTSTGKIQRVKLKPLFEAYKSKQFREK